MRELRAWAWGQPVRAQPASGGLINQTWWVCSAATDRPLAVVQRLNTRVFKAEVHHDIEAVTAHLASAGLLTPRLVRTVGGALWHVAPDGGVYRALTLVGERTFDAFGGPESARSAGALVARFHAATGNLAHTFQSVRPAVHDTPRHMRGLADALESHGGHRLFGAVAPLAAEILENYGRLSEAQTLPQRVIHGDLKVSNLRFDHEDAVALIDLDTLAMGTIDTELGDALRSWCNQSSEDAPEARFEVSLFQAAMEGYASAGALTAAEWSSVVPGVERICWELSARFARDALEEAYFGFDDRFGTRGDHNLLRARGQASLARSVAAQRDALEAALSRLRSPS